MKGKFDDVRMLLGEINEEIELKQDNEQAAETMELILGLLEELEENMIVER